MKKMFIDDNVIIPNEIKAMSKQELDAEISKFETEMKQKNIKPKSNQMA